MSTETEHEGPERWSNTRCTKCGHYPPCQCPGNPFGEGTGLDPETFPAGAEITYPAPDSYSGPAFALAGQPAVTVAYDPHLKGAQDGYQVEEWLTLVNSGQRQGDQPGPIYDDELFHHTDYGPAYRKGLAEGRARYIDECLERMASLRDSSGWRGVGLSTEGIPDPRDNGPYETEEQALAAMDQANYGIPVDGLDQLRALSTLQLHGALLMTGVVTTRYEESELRSLTGPEGAGTSGVQVITGWIMRAWLSGHVARGRNQP